MALELLEHHGPRLVVGTDDVEVVGAGVCRGGGGTVRSVTGTASDEILDVDLLAFERGDAGRRRAVVDGVCLLYTSDAADE